MIYIIWRSRDPGSWLTHYTPLPCILSWVICSHSTNVAVIARVDRNSETCNVTTDSVGSVGSMHETQKAIKPRHVHNVASKRSLVCSSVSHDNQKCMRASMYIWTVQKKNTHRHQFRQAWHKRRLSPYHLHRCLFGRQSQLDRPWNNQSSSWGSSFPCSLHSGRFKAA